MSTTFIYAIIWQPAGKPTSITPLREEGRGQREVDGLVELEPLVEWAERAVEGLKHRRRRAEQDAARQGLPASAAEGIGMPEDAEWRVVAMTDLPLDDQGRWNKRFRQCWRVSKEAVVVDLPLARAQVLAEVRAERGARLDASDKESAKLAEIGTREQQDALKAHRQALRDLPATVAAELAALTTADDLERYRPTWPAKE